MFKKVARLESWQQVLWALVIGFAVISFWRGIWGLLDIYLFPDDFVFRSWASTIIGAVILISTHYTVEELT